MPSPLKTPPCSATVPALFHSSLTPTSRLGESESTAMERSGSSSTVDERRNSTDSGVFDWPIVAVQRGWGRGGERSVAAAVDAGAPGPPLRRSACTLLL